MTTEQRILQIESELVSLKADLAKEAAKDYEILQFGNKSCLFTKHDSGWYTAPGKYHMQNEVTLLAREPIHSVRRLSDGTVWNVGDAFRLPDHNFTEKIESFIIKGDKISVDATRIMSPFALLVKPAHLFTTADGIPLYDFDQNVYSLSIWGANYTGNISEGPSGCIADWKRAYSTRLAAAKAYNTWLADQPVLSLNDISRFIDIGPYCELEALVKDKISKR